MSGDLPIRLRNTFLAAARPLLAGLLGLLLVACFCDRCLPRAVAANPCGNCARPDDSIWLVSTRQAPCAVSCDGAEPRLRYYRFESSDPDAPRQWQPSDAATFFTSAPPEGITLFYVHGNSVSSSEAFRRGLAIYRGVARHAQDDWPVRFVIWSWPTTSIRGVARDVRTKAYRAGPAGYRLAWFVNRLDPQTPVRMIGFSFGARVITGSLHVLGGGRLGRLALPAATDRTPIRAVLMAAALDQDWLVPGHYHGLALTQVDRILLLNNSCDRAMKWYPLIDRCRRPQALGRNGIATCALGMEAQKVVQRDVCCQVGRVHGFQNYLGAPSLMAQAWEFVRAEVPVGVKDEHLVMDRTVE
jgi:hypothetical protein